MADETTQDEVMTHREAAAEALEQNDSAKADLEYAAELEALEDNTKTEDGEQDEGEQGIESFSPEVVENIFATLTDEFGEEQVATLQAHWPDNESAREGLALGQALVTDHPELVSIIEEYGLQDHPAMLRLAEFIARKSGYTFDADGARKSMEAPMETKSGLSRESFAKGMRNFSERIELAQSDGNSKLANDLHIQQQEWIASVKGNKPIVGGRGRQQV